MTYLDALLLGGLMAGGAFLFAYLVGKMGEASIEGRPEVKWIEDRLPRRAQLESRLELRKAESAALIARMTVEANNLRRKRFAAEKDLLDARREQESPIRVIGREGVGDVHFRAWLINRQVQAALSENKSHPTLDVDWATPQIVEVWADNINDARKELQRIYPLPLGFTVLNIKIEMAEEPEVEPA